MCMVILISSYYIYNLIFTIKLNSFTFYNALLHQKDTEDKKLEEEIKQAIVNNELVVFYQAQMDASINTITGLNLLSDGIIQVEVYSSLVLFYQLPKKAL